MFRTPTGGSFCFSSSTSVALDGQEEITTTNGICCILHLCSSRKYGEKERGRWFYSSSTVPPPGGGSQGNRPPPPAVDTIINAFGSAHLPLAVRVNH